jgi:hypothetical protein
VRCSAEPTEADLDDTLGLGRKHGLACEAARKKAGEALDQIHLALQLFSYPGNYLAEQATSERIAETLRQLAEDTSWHLYDLWVNGQRK